MDRSRTSGEYLFVLFMTPSSQVLESPTNPGRFRIETSTRSVIRSRQPFSEALKYSTQKDHVWLSSPGNLGHIPYYTQWINTEIIISALLNRIHHSTQPGSLGIAVLLNSDG